MIKRFNKKGRTGFNYCCLFQSDHFKRYNDDFGHLVGDATLKEVADLLKRNLRRVDLVGRYGGEEFIVVMPETRIANAAEVAERIRSNIARHDFQRFVGGKAGPHRTHNNVDGAGEFLGEMLLAAIEEKTQNKKNENLFFAKNLL